MVGTVTRHMNQNSNPLNFLVAFDDGHEGVCVPVEVDVLEAVS